MIQTDMQSGIGQACSPILPDDRPFLSTLC